ncbi:phosphatidate cytidylyltransferase [Sphingomonas bacterium]|uniref:phosphatidate cytidylyltransferase n=1 Tax=Sphingomonas bacterium TaxID=1895847 RepID=UPI001575C09E|nr:phosphatidate cytidylyltransferase [Sphingomonas bacterium]
MSDRSNRSELVLRVVTGAALIAIAMVALALGGIVFWLLATLVGLLMMAEWADLNGISLRHKRLALYSLFVPLALMSPLGAGPGFLSLGLLAGAAFFIVIITNRRELALGTLYCGLPVLALLLIRRQHAAGPDLSTYPGVIYALWALALVWATDIGAYFAGRTIGGPKLAPRVSPNKTWAGLVGGVALASSLAIGMQYRYGLPVRLTLATPVLAVLAQGGDLYESWLKRRAGVKDSGRLIPGHGGVLDRLDGLVPVAPVAAFLVVLPHFYP